MNILNNSTQVSEVVLPVIVDGYKWECNNDRMWNLNELHKAKDLPDNKLPSEWDNAVKTTLLETGNFRVERDGKTWCTLATEAGAIAYAMWVSTPFYLTVVNAFIELRNDNVIKARNLAHQNATIKPIAASEFAKLRTGHGWTLTDSLKRANVPNPNLVIKLLKSGRMSNPFYIVKPPKDLSGPQRVPNEKGRLNGYWKLPEGDGRFNKHGLKVCEKGFEWLKENVTEITRQVATMKGSAKMRGKGTGL
ncbi:TPA: hypothetical protein ACGPMY_001423 [Yersinia enterocolitica]